MLMFKDKGKLLGIYFCNFSSNLEGFGKMTNSLVTLYLSSRTNWLCNFFDISTKVDKVE